MSGARWALIVLLLGGFAVAAWMFLAGGETPGGGGGDPHKNWANTDCRSCHQDVWDEWEPGWHHLAYVDPLYKKMTNNYADTSCDDCHIPRNIPEVGFGPRTLARVSDKKSGIHCLSCHFDGTRIVAARDNPSAPCTPRGDPQLSSEMSCIGCHNQHKLHEEWRATPYFKQGIGCIDCHMPEVDRVRNGKVVKGRRHGFISSRRRDPNARLGVDIEVKGPADDGGAAGRLAVSITNARIGHNFPSDSRHKAVDLITTFFRTDGSAIGDPRVERFHNPLRQATDQTNTQIPHGVTRRFDYDVPTDAVRARVDLLYRIMKTDPDGDAHRLFRRDVQW